MSFHNVKLESSSTIKSLPASARAFPPGRCVRTAPVNFALWALRHRAGFRLGLARPLSQRPHDRQPTPFRALRRPPSEEARHGITVGRTHQPPSPVGFPVPGCLARSHPQLIGCWTSGTLTAIDPVDAYCSERTAVAFRVFFPR